MANRVYGYQGYKGYQFETSPKKLQPEYEPERHQKPEKKPQTKTVTKKSNKSAKESEIKRHKMSKAEFKKRATFIAYIVFGFSVLFTISYRNSIINERFTEKEALKTELAGIQKVNKQLEVNIENELNLTNIEELAEETLGMSKLSNEQKVYVSLSKKEYVEAKTDGIVSEQTETLYQKIYNNIVSFFS